jgi:hypothetical protein
VIQGLHLETQSKLFVRNEVFWWLVGYQTSSESATGRFRLTHYQPWKILHSRKHSSLPACPQDYSQVHYSPKKPYKGTQRGQPQIFDNSWAF